MYLGLDFLELTLSTAFGFSSMKEYEDKAVELAENPPKLQALINKLKAVRLTCPLFDTGRWVSFFCSNFVLLPLDVLIIWLWMLGFVCAL